MLLSYSHYYLPPFKGHEVLNCVNSRTQQGCFVLQFSTWQTCWHDNMGDIHLLGSNIWLCLTYMVKSKSNVLSIHIFALLWHIFDQNEAALYTKGAAEYNINDDIYLQDPKVQKSKIVMLFCRNKYWEIKNVKCIGCAYSVFTLYTWVSFGIIKYHKMVLCFKWAL